MAIGLLWSVPLLWRKRFPLAVPLFVGGVVALASFYVPAAVENDLSLFGGLLASWSLGAHNDRRRAVAGFGVLYALVIVIQSNVAPLAAVEVFFFTLIFGAAALAGQVLRGRELRTEELRERTVRLEREREAQAIAAVAEERARIARELHDVVAHSISVMTIQAGAARLLLDQDPERAEEPLLSIEETGRETLAEMRRLLGVLRRDMAADTLEARPTMANLESLVAEVRASGLPVELSVAGEAFQIGPGVDLAAYRIVQEALTNVRKHAGLVPTRVAVRYGPSALEVEVENDAGNPAERRGRRRSWARRHARARRCVRRHARRGREQRGRLSRACHAASWERAMSRAKALLDRLRANADFVLAAVLVATGQAEAWSGQLDADSAAVAVVMLGVTLPLFFVRLSPSLAGLAVLAALAGAAFVVQPATEDSITTIVRGSGGVSGGSAPIGLRCGRWSPGWRATRCSSSSSGKTPTRLASEISFSPRCSASAPGSPATRSPVARSGRQTSSCRASILEDEREAQARAAVAAERARIARELHDVIAHSVSVMTVQAGAARLLLAQDPERAREPILAVEETGREALAETRRLLGILRSDMSEAELEPQPGMASLETLVARTRLAGLPVELTVEGDAVKLAPGLDLAAYRVVQEALTNALKYAGPAHAWVTVRYLRDAARARDLERRALARATERLGRPRARRHARARIALRRLRRGRATPRTRIRRPRPTTAGRSRMIRVLIADDQALVRGGFRLILQAQPDMEVVGEAEDGRLALQLARELQPDVVLMDIRMPELDGIEATRRLGDSPDAPRVLMLTTFDMNEYVYEAMKSGASGFLLKDVRPEQLADAVRTVAAGDALLAPSITRRLIEEYVRRPPPGQGRPPELERADRT